MPYNIKWGCKTCDKSCEKVGCATLTEAVCRINKKSYTCHRRYGEVSWVEIEGFPKGTAWEIYDAFTERDVLNAATTDLSTELMRT